MALVQVLDASSPVASIYRGLAINLLTILYLYLKEKTQEESKHIQHGILFSIHKLNQEIYE